MESCTLKISPCCLVYLGEEAEKKDDAIISTWCNEEWKRNDSVSSWPINITDPFCYSR